jgi:hypothetical protein
MLLGQAFEQTGQARSLRRDWHPRGEKGEKGEPGTTVVAWQLDRQRYRISPLMSDGRVGPMLELRGLFEQSLSETS